MPHQSQENLLRRRPGFRVLQSRVGSVKMRSSVHRKVVILLGIWNIRNRRVLDCG